MVSSVFFSCIQQLYEGHTLLIISQFFENIYLEHLFRSNKLWRIYPCYLRTGSALLSLGLSGLMGYNHVNVASVYDLTLAYRQEIRVKCMTMNIFRVAGLLEEIPNLDTFLPETLAMLPQKRPSYPAARIKTANLMPTMSEIITQYQYWQLFTVYD